jgi:peptide deformylase
LNIITAPNDVLTMVCYTPQSLNINFLAEMFALMDQHKGLGLAAPQVGLPARFFITSWGEVFVDPEIIPIEEYGKVVVPEGCLSIPGETYEVERWRVVEVNGKRYGDVAAIVIQHEADHLDGILISEKGKLCQSTTPKS